MTGLQFVVMALIAESRQRNSMREVSAFGTPTVVHFCAALLVSAILSAPWHRLPSVALALGTCGVAGLVYVALVVRQARRQSGYAPVMEDWIWHTILPTVSYGTLFVAALVLSRGPQPSLFFVGAAVLLLVFIGIHNAWDTVTYFASGAPGAGVGYWHWQANTS